MEFWAKSHDAGVFRFFPKLSSDCFSRGNFSWWEEGNGSGYYIWERSSDSLCEARAIGIHGQVRLATFQQTDQVFMSLLTQLLQKNTMASHNCLKLENSCWERNLCHF